MANIPLKTLQFPGLDDTYTIPQVDSEMSDESTNPVQNKVVKEYVDAMTPELSGNAPDLYAGNLISDLHTTDQTPYNFRATPHEVGDREELEIVGCSVGWNQLVDTATTSVTIPSGHKYYSSINGTKTVGASTGTAISINDGTKDQVTDLTLCFGTTIADYVYSLEQATAGSGVAWLKHYFPKMFGGEYHAYDAGSIQSVSGLSAHVMRGFNQWDEEWEVGDYKASDGTPYASDRIRSKKENYIRVLPNTEYYLKTANDFMTIYFYDAEKTYIGNTTKKDTTVTTPDNCCFVRFSLATTYGTTYNHDICINLHWDGERDGQYEPYISHSYALDDTITLRGMLKLDSTNVPYADGDVYLPSGEVQRKYAYEILDGVNKGVGGIVDAPTSYDVSGKMALITTSTVAYPTENVLFVGFSGYFKYSNRTHCVDNGIAQTASSGIIRWLRSDLSTEEDFNAELKAKYDAGKPYAIVYELATPTTESATPYQSIQSVDNWGTEEFVSTSMVSVGHRTKYPVSIKKQVENIYGIPAPPKTAGTFQLQCVVADGKPTYTWVSAT